jgi:hypothetical protein
LLLVAKHIGEREVQSELAELHLDLQCLDGIGAPVLVQSDVTTVPSVRAFFLSPDRS